MSPSSGRLKDTYWNTVWNVEPFTVIWWYGRANPDLALSIQYLSTTPWNDARYNNAVLDGLILKARGQDLEGQIETYAEIQRILIDDVPRIVAAYQPWSYGIRTNLRGVTPHPLGFPLLQDGWFDD